MPPTDADPPSPQDGKVESVDGPGDPAVTDEAINNVMESEVKQDEEGTHAVEASSDSISTSSAVAPINTTDSMSPLISLADISFHSPSSGIVGTPFSDAYAGRFEYPFPDRPSATGSPETGLGSPAPLASPSSAVSGPTSQLSLNTPPSLKHFPASFPSPPELHLPSYSPTHPKMRTVDPPVPPALVKRKQRWTLGLGSLKRKLSLRSGSAPTGSVIPGNDVDISQRRSASDSPGIGNGEELTLSPTSELPPLRAGAAHEKLD